MTVFLDSPADAFDARTAFWCEVTGSRVSATRGERAEFVTLLPPSGDAYLRAQRLGEGPARVHLDVHVEEAALSLDGASRLAVGLGACELRREDDVVVLTSPGGFVFCLVRWDGESEVPAPVTLDEGGPNRADQLCLDIPPDSYETECAFWAALTGWPLHAGSLPEYRSLERPAGHPVRILLQRRLEAADADQVTGHLDIATEHREELAPLHERAGARIVRRETFWITLTDPAAQAYCLTPRDPATGKLRPR
jgi:hypothetical protein